MTELKTKTMRERVVKGNKNAQIVIDYMNHRFEHSNFIPSAVQTDMKDKIDYEQTANKNDTLQVKVREQRRDFIYESDKFVYDHEGPPTPKTKFRRIPGRDAVSKARRYACKPKQYNPEVIYIAKASEIKSVSENLHQEWPEGNDVNDSMIYNAWKTANFYDSKQCMMFHGENKSEIIFKIEEGSDRKLYGKFLSFIPPECLKTCKSIVTRPGEEMSRPETWLPR